MIRLWRISIRFAWYKLCELAQVLLWMTVLSACTAVVLAALSAAFWALGCALVGPVVDPAAWALSNPYTLEGAVDHAMLGMILFLATFLGLGLGVLVFGFAYCVWLELCELIKENWAAATRAVDAEYGS